MASLILCTLYDSDKEENCATVKILRGMSLLRHIFAPVSVYSLVFIETDGDKMP